MTIELSREQDRTFQFEYFAIFQKVINLAEVYGWVPAGTAQPVHWQGKDPHEEWSGRYDLYEGEWVHPQDAAAMADALEKALPDLPDHDMPERIIETEMHEIDRENQVSVTFHIIEANQTLNLFEVFGGQYKRELIDFIDFCRRGGFHIYNPQ